VAQWRIVRETKIEPGGIFVSTSVGGVNNGSRIDSRWKGMNYNTLLADVECPFCRAKDPIGIQFEYGFLDFTRYELGDGLLWDSNREWCAGVHVYQGESHVEGLAFCQNCDKYFDVMIFLTDNIFVSVMPKQPI
jgi:hypothetical protein